MSDKMGTACLHQSLRQIQNIKYFWCTLSNTVVKMASKLKHLLAWATITHLTFNLNRFLPMISTPDRRQSKTLILSTSVDKKSLETELLLAIWRLTGDKWQSSLFQAIFDPRSSMLRAFSIATYIWFKYFYQHLINSFNS